MKKKIFVFFILLFLNLPCFSAVQSITDFSGGLHKDSPDVIPDNCAVDITNFYIDEDVGLVKRQGYQKDNTVYFGSAPVRNIIEYSRVSGETYKIVVCSNTIYSDSPSTKIIENWNNGNETTTLVWLDKIFFINPSENLVAWDGSTTTVYYSAPKGRYGVVYGDRLYLAGVNGDESTIFYSAINNPISFPTSNWDYVGTDDNDYITGLVVYESDLIIFKSRSMWKLIGTDINTMVLRNITKETGCIDSRSIQQLFGNLYFLSYRGLEKFGGIIPTKITTKIDNYINKVRQIKGKKTYSAITTATDWGKGTFFGIGIDTYTTQGSLTLNSDTENIGSGKNLISMVIDNSTATHIVYLNTANQVIYSSYTIGIGWNNIKITSNTTLPSSLEIDVDSNRNPHLIWWNTGGIYYASNTYNVGFSTTQLNSFASFLTEPQSFTCLKIDRLNNPHTLYYAGVGIVYSSFTPTKGWSSTTVFPFDLNDDSTQSLDLALDNSNNAHVIYTSGTAYDLYYTSFTPTKGFSVPKLVNNGIVYDSALAIDNINGVHTVYNESNDLKYSSYTPNTSWNTTTIETSYAEFGNQCDIHVGNNNIPYIIYEVNKTNYSHSLVYTSYTWTTASWSGISNIGSIGEAGGDMSLDLDGNNRAKITYYYTGSILKYYTDVYEGIYISTSIYTGTEWISWGMFNAGETLRDATIGYHIKTSTFLAGLTNATWNTINNGDMITGTTPYIQYKVTMYINTPSSIPVLGNISTNWYEDYLFYPCSSVIYKDRYWLSLSTTGTLTTNSSVLVMDRNNNFTKFQGINAYCLSLWQNDLYSGSALNDGWIYKQDITCLYTDNGTNISCEYITKDFCFNDPISEKIYQTIWLTADNKSGTLTLNYALDGSTVTWSSSIDTSLTQTDRIITEKIPLSHATRGRYIRLKFSNTGAYDCIIRRAEILYDVLPLR